MEVPMLDEEEYRLVMEARRKGMDFVREEQERRDPTDLPPVDLPAPAPRTVGVLEGDHMVDIEIARVADRVAPVGVYPEP